jgi:CRP/FNR family cyclic AMP-dependent transcriptional regulator
MDSCRLSDEGQTELIAAGTSRVWQSGETLMRESDATDHVVLITRGRVKISSAAPSGRQVLLAVRGPGELLGESSAIDGGARSATITAMTRVEAIMLTGSEFQRFLHRTPAVAFELLKIVTGRLRESTQRRLEYGAYGVPTRTALLLIHYALTMGEQMGGRITVKLRQSDLADAAGASREAVAKALRTLRDVGAVRTNRCSFDVLSLDLLYEFAGDK